MATALLDVAHVLSPSQVSGWLACSAKWYARYGLGLPETRTASLARGSAVHKAVAVYHKTRMLCRPELPPSAIGEIAEISFEMECTQDENRPVLFEEGENFDDLRAQAGMLAAYYVEQIGESVQPAAVEQRFEGVIGGVPVQGYVDLLDSDGRVCDLKVSGRALSAPRADQRMQVTTYNMLCQQAGGAGRLDVLVPLKAGPKLTRIDFEISDADIAYAERMFPLAQEGMRSGLIVPNRDSNLCSRKYCPFADWCEREFGGEVSK